MRKLSLLFLGLIFIPSILLGDGWLGGISLYIITEQINCKMVYSYQKDTPYTKFDATLNEGEVVRIVDQNSENQYIATKFHQEGYLIFDTNVLRNKSVSISYSNDKLEILKQLSESEQLISFMLDHPVYLYHDQLIKVTNIAGKILSQHKADKMKILCVDYDENYKKKLFIKDVLIEQIRTMYQYNYNRYIEGKSPEQNYLMLRQIISDETIPYAIKRQYISTFLYYYNDNTNNLITKDEYFNFVLKVIDEYPEYVLPDFETSSQIDQQAMFSIFRSFKDNVITLNEYYEISSKIIKIDKNPAVTLLAYSALVKYYLLTNNDNIALQTVIESIKKYDQPILWNYYKTVSYLNAKPALVYLDYLMEHENNPHVITEFIDQLIKTSSSHPEFQNFLVYRKALVKELFAYPVEDVIAAYQQINTEPENIYTYTSPFSSRKYSVFFWEMEQRVLSRLKAFEKYSIFLDSQIKVKKYILAEELETIDLKKETEIIVHHESPYLLSQYGSNEFVGWVKGEIEGQIFWVFIE